MKITFLGTGTSVGVPVIGCECEVCVSDDPRDKRRRSSIYLTASDDTRILVDCGPDLREQCLRAKINKVDAVLITHGHTDHIMGFDDLRPFSWHRDNGLPVYATRETLESVRQSFGFAFDDASRTPGYFHPDPHEVASPFTVGTTTITPLPVVHGKVDTVGYLFETAEGRRIAYMSDVKSVPESTRALMAGLDGLIVDSLRHVPHATHMSLSEALQFSTEMGYPATWLTHFTHEILTSATEETLPPHVRMAYDTLTIEL